MSDKPSSEAIINEIKKCKQELKSSIQALEAKLSLKIKEINRRLMKSENESLEFEQRLERIEQKQRENYIVIFNLQTGVEINSEGICQLKKLVNVTLNESDLNNWENIKIIL